MSPYESSSSLRSARRGRAAALAWLLVLGTALPGLLPAAQAADRPMPAPERSQRQAEPLPVQKGMPNVELQPPRTAVLDNGLRVFVLPEASGLPVFTARLVFTHAGGLYEPADRRGLAAFTLDMLRQGSRSRDELALSRELETLGVTLETEARLDSATASLTLTGLSSYAGPAMALLADLVRNPAFDPREVEKHASRMLDRLELQRAQPAFLGQEQLLRALYRDHPAAWVAPSPEMIRATTVEDLRRFHAAHYRPDQALLVMTGKVELDAVLPLLREAFGDWPRGRGVPPALPAIPAPAAKSVMVVDRPGAIQTTLQVGTIGLARKDPDYIPLTLMVDVLNVRLYDNLRETHGYTYGAYNGFSAGAVPGPWQVSTSVRTDVTAPAMRELMAELRRIGQAPAAASELADSRRSVVGKFIISLERPEVRVGNVVDQVLYGLPQDYWARYADQVQAVSAAQLMSVARRIVDLPHLQVAAVGDAARIRDGLAAYGEPNPPDAAPPAEAARSQPDE